MSEADTMRAPTPNRMRVEPFAEDPSRAMLFITDDRGDTHAFQMTRELAEVCCGAVVMAEAAIAARTVAESATDEGGRT